MKLHCVLSLASMMASVNSCEYAKDAIHGLYDRAEEFRKTKIFDSTNLEVPLTHAYKYEYDEIYGINVLQMRINYEYMMEHYKNIAANEIETIDGHYGVDGKGLLRFNRNENGEFVFKNIDYNDVEFTLRSFDAELPNNLREDYKQLLLDLKTMRQKMFDFQKGLSKDELERVQIFDYTIFSNGNFLSMYTENDGGSITVNSAKTEGKEIISGQISCKNKIEKFKFIFD